MAEAGSGPRGAPQKPFLTFGLSEQPSFSAGSQEGPSRGQGSILRACDSPHFPHPHPGSFGILALFEKIDIFTRYENCVLMFNCTKCLP